MRIGPKKDRKMDVTIVCLEHGKPDPSPRMAYKMVPIEEFSDDARVAAVCQALGYGQLTQKTAQAATWNIMDGLTWQQLANKNKVESKYLGNIRWFTGMELRMAQAVVAEATRIAANAESSNDSPGYDK